MAASAPSTDVARRKQRKTRGKPNNVDVHVGSRVRQRRTMLGLSQEKLAHALNLTFQQVQKYERGANRIGAGRLFQLSQALGVPVSYFFEAIEEAGGESVAEGAGDNVQARQDTDLLSQRETLSLVRAYFAISDPAVRRRVVDLMRAMASGEEPSHLPTSEGSSPDAKDADVKDADVKDAC